jgi:hypothetical protein
MTILTCAGAVEVETVYGQDRETRRWLNPFREVLGLSGQEKMSPVLEERLCFTAALTGSYEKAGQMAGKWGCPVADDSTIHQHVQTAGARAAWLHEERVERALDVSTRADVVREAGQEAPRGPFSLVLMMDGWMVRERGGDWGLKPPEKQGERVAWHEMKTGVVFRLEAMAKSQSGRGFLIEKYYEAWRGSPEEFGRRFYAQALRRGLNQAERVYVVADGGAWIWNLVEDRFSDAVGVLDFYHASEHLWAVAREIYGEDETAARRWVQRLLHQLKHGEEDRVLSHLNQTWRTRSRRGSRGADALAQLCQYLERHRDHLHYQQVESEGCPKGSGAVESTCSQLQDRFKRCGQFWSLDGETALLELEQARRNNDWDEIWNDQHEFQDQEAVA